LLEPIRDSARSVDFRKEIFGTLASTHHGARALVECARGGDIPADLLVFASERLNNVNPQWEDVRSAAAEILPLPLGKDGQTLPPTADLIRMAGDAERGAAVYDTLCLQCHQVDGKGTEYGPNLSHIGAKLGKDALCDSILNPSAGISFGYEAHSVDLASGTQTVGFILGQTENELTLREAGGIVTTYPASEVVSIERQEASVMPEGLEAGMSAQEFADLLEYLSTLK
jgi:putative heme-binding domain-containing protein